MNNDDRWRSRVRATSGVTGQVGHHILDRFSLGSETAVIVKSSLTTDVQIGKRTIESAEEDQRTIYTF